MQDEDLGIIEVDTQLGGDADLSGIAQPITLSEIQDIVQSTDPVTERQQKLNTIKSDLMARHSADTEAGFRALIDEVDRGIALLAQRAEGATDPEILRRTDDAATPKGI